MHNAILGIIALFFSIYCFVTKKIWAGAGFLLIAIALGFFFLVTMKILPIDITGIGLTILFIIGCLLIIWELRE